MKEPERKESQIYYNYKEWKRLEEISFPYEEALRHVINAEESHFHVEFIWKEEKLSLSIPKEVLLAGLADIVYCYIVEKDSVIRKAKLLWEEEL
ncbi:TPA: hypothetical protein IW741_002856 [Enterococcus faecium]|nr:hypothetical protein [Enterococcus faecium]